jgi:hypothetical protein
MSDTGQGRGMPKRTAETEPPPAPERRRARRLDLSLTHAIPVSLRTHVGLLRGWGRNVSDGGMLVEATVLPPIGTDLEVTLYPAWDAPDHPSMTLEGEVRHHLAWQYTQGPERRTLRAMGIRFKSSGAGWVDRTLPLH